MSTATTFADLRGLRFHYEVTGRTGAPCLVFSNSLMTNLTAWDAQERAFSGSYRVLRYDQRGHGQTEAPPTSCSFDELAGDLDALCEHAGIDRAVFVGVSMGGVTALRLAQLHPHRVAGIVACDCQWFSPATSKEVWEDRICTASEQGMGALVESTIARWFRPAFVARRTPALDHVRDMIATTPVDGFIACARALQSYDIRPDFARVTMPTCFLVGDGDGVLPTVMREMHRGLPGSAFVQIAEAGHLPNIEQAAAVNHLIQAFLIEIGWHGGA